MYRFSLRMDAGFRVGLVVLSVVLVAMPVAVRQASSTVLALLLMLFITGILYRIKHYAYYELGPKCLSYSMGFGERQIPIEQIRWVKRSSYTNAGRRAALARKGLLIGYGAGYELFISPEEEEAFKAKLEELLAAREQ